jgi:hypothetical protein
MDEDVFPPSRKRRWPVFLLVTGAVGALSLPGILRYVAGRSADQVSSTLVALIAGIGGGVVLGVGIFWIFYRPGRLLISTLVKSGSDEAIAIYSSKELEHAIKALNGVVLGSSSWASSAFLAFVDTGSKFEIWRWHRSRPECVARVPWARIASIAVDSVAHDVTTDRAIVLNLTAGGRDLRLPISPQHCRVIRIRPMKDDAFAATLDRFRSRLAESRPERESAH